MCLSKEEAQEDQLKALTLLSLTNSDPPLIANCDALPDCLLQQILCLLPGADVPVTGAVCRRWRRLLANYLLYPVRQADDSRLHWSGWDAAAARWRLFSLPPAMTSCQWLASARGLVLACSGKRYMVCNPVTAAFRNLPDFPNVHALRPMLYRVGLVVMVSEFALQVDVGDGKTYVVRALVTRKEAPDPTGMPTEPEYPWLVEYRRGAPEWTAALTAGRYRDLEAALFQPHGKVVVAGGELFVVGGVGRPRPARVMALDLATKAWRVAAWRGVRFTDALVLSRDRVFLVREEEELLLSSSAAGRGGKTFVVYSVAMGGAADTSEGGLAVESRCDSGLFPQHPHISEPAMWSVMEFAGAVYITCGSQEEPAHHAGVVYDVAPKVWRKWCGGRTWPEGNVVPSTTKCFEWGMATAP